MSLTLNFELNDRDLEHFHAAMEASKKAAEGRSDAEIIENAGRLLALTAARPPRSSAKAAEMSRSSSVSRSRA